MIKKLLSAALLIIASGIINSYAQYTPNAACASSTDYGIYPDSATSIASGTVGLAYSQTLSIKTPPTAAHWSTAGALIDSIWLLSC